MTMTRASRRRRASSASGVACRAATAFCRTWRRERHPRAASIQRTENGSGASASTRARPTCPAPNSSTGVAALAEPFVERRPRQKAVRRGFRRRVAMPVARTHPADSHRAGSRSRRLPLSSCVRSARTAARSATSNVSISVRHHARRSIGRDRGRAASRETAPRRARRQAPRGPGQDLALQAPAADRAAKSAIRAQHHARAALARRRTRDVDTLTRAAAPCRSMVSRMRVQTAWPCSLPYLVRDSQPRAASVQRPGRPARHGPQNRFRRRRRVERHGFRPAPAHAPHPRARRTRRCASISGGSPTAFER